MRHQKCHHIILYFSFNIKKSEDSVFRNWKSASKRASNSIKVEFLDSQEPRKVFHKALDCTSHREERLLSKARRV